MFRAHPVCFLSKSTYSIPAQPSPPHTPSCPCPGSLPPDPGPSGFQSFRDKQCRRPAPQDAHPTTDSFKPTQAVPMGAAVLLTSASCSRFPSQSRTVRSLRSLSHVQLFVSPLAAAHQASLSITNCWSLLKLMSIESVMPSNHLILCRPFLLMPSIFPSLRVFSNESVLPIRLSKYWRFIFSISPSNEYSGLISLRINWFDILAVPRTLKSLL